jgi:chromosome segregation ATPase
MTKNGTETAESVERAQLQADVARQRVRLAKDELHRARKRLKEAKREARRARKFASLARKDWKRARRHAEKKGPAEAPADVVAAQATGKPRTRVAAAPRSRRKAASRVPVKRTRPGSKAKLAR